MKSLTLPASHPQACADREGGGGGRGVGIPWKITSYMGFFRNKHKEKVRPPPPGKFWTPSGSFEKYSFLCNETIGPPLLTVV